MEVEKPGATLRLPDIYKDRRPRIAVRVADNSANKVVSEGEYAIVEPLTSREIAQLPVSTIVLVERVRGTLKERTIRRVRRSSDAKLELGCHSTEKRFAQKLTYPSGRKGEKIEIIGRVVGRYADLA